jgi:hypothetical protein
MQTFNLSDYISGDTWNGIPLISITRNSEPIDLTDAKVEMFVKYQIDAPTVAYFTTENGSIIILDPSTNGRINVPPQIVDIPPAKYIFSIKITFSNGEVDTFVSGNWNVIKTA